MSQPIRPSRQPIYCLDCGYVLNGIASASCPECGRSFSLHDPSTYMTYQRSFHRKVFEALTPRLFRAIGVVNGIMCALAMAALAGSGYAPDWVVPLLRILGIRDETLSIHSRRSEMLAVVLLLGAINAGVCLACMMIVAKRRKRHAVIPRVSLTLGVINGIVCAVAVVAVVFAFAIPEPLRSVPPSVFLIGALGAGLCAVCMIVAAKRDQRKALIPGLLQALGAISAIVCALAVVMVILASHLGAVERSVLEVMSRLGVLGAGLCVVCMIIAICCSERHALIPGVWRALITVNAIMCALAGATVMIAPHIPRLYSWVTNAAPLFAVVSAGLCGACMARARR
jgi:hypothetical protein